MRVYDFRLLLLALLLCSSLATISGADIRRYADSPPPSTSPPKYEGYVDWVTCDAVMAWGWDATQPNDPIKLDIRDNGFLTATVLADKFRQDLLNAGKGNGKHSVLWQIPAEMKDGRPHTLTVNIADSDISLGTPRRINCKAQE